MLDTSCEETNTKKVMKESMLPVQIMMKQRREAASAGADQIMMKQRREAASAGADQMGGLKGSPLAELLKNFSSIQKLKSVYQSKKHLL